MVERILTSNFKKLNSGKNLQYDSIKILEQDVVQKNIDIFKKFFESLENYDSQYWSIYYSDNNKLINIDIGEYKIVEIGPGYFSMIVDITLFNTNDYKFLLNNLSDEQKSIFENDFSDDFVNLYITSEISNKEFEILTAAQNIALSKVFGDTYNTPKNHDNEELLNYFSISNPGLSIFLILAGPMTVIPLFLYVRGVELIGLGPTGMIFYITPTLQFLLGFFYYDEPFSSLKFLSFIIIWIAVIIYLKDLYEKN